MTRSFRALASVLLLVAGLCCPAATGIVLAHVAQAHIESAEHHHHDSRGVGHAGEHETQPVGGHGHEIAEFSLSTSGRALDRADDGPQHAVLVSRAPDGLTSPSAHRVSRPPEARAHPPDPRLSTVLLI